MILNTIAAKLRRRSKDDFKGRHFEAALILQAVSWYLRYPLSSRDIEELFRERGLEVDHSTLNRWVLAYAPLIERRLRSFRKPHCGSVRIDETYIKIRGQWRYLSRAIDKIRGQWRYLSRAIDKHGTPVDFLLTAKRDLDAATRFFRKMLADQPLLAPDRIGTDGAGPYPPAIAAARKDGLLPHDPVHYVTKHLQQGIESDQGRRAAYRTFDRLQKVNQAAIVENKRLSEVLAFVAERQRERTETRSIKAPRRRGQAERHMFKLN
jgi:IS6 family transposase